VNQERDQEDLTSQRVLKDDARIAGRAAQWWLLGSAAVSLGLYKYQLELVRLEAMSRDDGTGFVPIEYLLT